MSPQKAELSIEAIPGVGEKLKHSFQKLGVFTLNDLIYFLPKNVLDLTNIIAIESVRENLERQVVINAEVEKTSIIKSRIKHMWLVEATLKDQTGQVESIWFNQPFIHKNLKKGESYFFYGLVSLNNNKIILSNPQVLSRSGIFPIYKQSKNLSSKKISKVISKILKPSIFPADIIPKNVLTKYKLPSLFEASKKAHQPKTKEDFSSGRYRFLFEELFLFALTNQFIKEKFKSQKGFRLKVNESSLKEKIYKLPFKLTGDQKAVLSEVVDDLKSLHPMNRLIQGDVGSGKKIIAFLACLLSYENSCKSVFMAPTEILAIQHYETFTKFKDLLNLSNLKVCLVTGKNKGFDKDADVFIGTHALLNKNFEDLALVIVDEQQRFGVEQRNMIIEKNGKIPHYLSLSATPIPRTLFHTIFSSLDLSVINEKPKDRIKIKTYLIPEGRRNDSYLFIDNLIKKGQQVFIVCPLINHDPDNDKFSVESQILKLRSTILGARKIGTLHGKLSADKKNEIMSKFQDGDIDILVSTSVIEVGIDIKNATVMVIEDADSFGLAQLHQFRGRVGRGKLESFCFIFSKKLSSQKTKDRLKAFVQNDNGFELANFDLKLRGPGAFFDVDQSGFKGINPLWFESSKLLSDATTAAKKTIDTLDTYPDLKQKIESLANINHLE